jgi:hypothetical protein
MKRIFILSVMLAVALSSFAYYGDYSSSGESAWQVFINLISFVCGILGVILFFKIWGMANDIKALKKDHFNENSFGSYYAKFIFLRRSIILGKKDVVRNAFLMDFIDNVENGFNGLKKYEYIEDEKGKTKWTSMKEENYKKSIRPYVEHLQKQFYKIGEELPVCIQRMETFGDYFNLLTENDFVIKKENSVEQKETAN